MCMAFVVTSYLSFFCPSFGVSEMLCLVPVSFSIVLRFYGPVNKMGPCRARSVLSNHTFTGQV